MDWVGILVKLVDVAIIVGGAVILGTIKTLKENNAALKERVNILETETKDCKEGHEKSQEQIQELKDKINKTINIPLVKIEKHMDHTNKILEKMVEQNDSNGVR